jgi:hypothetical protein
MGWAGLQKKDGVRPDHIGVPRLTRALYL